MSTKAFLYSSACGLAALCLSTQAHALPITVNTTWLDANGILSLSTSAQQALQLTGIQVSASGSTADLGGGRFNLPVTELSASLGFFTVTPVAAKVAGAGLDFNNRLNGKLASIQNLQINFENQLIFGNIVSGGVTKSVQLFSFDVAAPLKLSFTGGVSFNESLNNLRMTQSAADSFAAAVGLPAYLSSVLTGIDFGTVDATIRPWFRTTVASVPEPSTWTVMALGLVGVMLATSRRSAKTDRGSRS